MSDPKDQPAAKRPSLAFPILASLTLGLAPFLPEPHLVGKIRWVMGGAVGMGTIDWFDLVWHAWPWVWLVAALVNLGAKKVLQ